MQTIPQISVTALGIPIAWLEAIVRTDPGATFVTVLDEDTGKLVRIEIGADFTERQRDLLKIAISSDRARVFCQHN